MRDQCLIGGGQLIVLGWDPVIRTGKTIKVKGFATMLLYVIIGT